jgi:hypothetical protein
MVLTSCLPNPRKPFKDTFTLIELMAFEREISVLRAIKEKRRAPMAWATICRIYAGMRKDGLIVKAGKSHALTERGERLLEIFGRR